MSPLDLLGKGKNFFKHVRLREGLNAHAVLLIDLGKLEGKPTEAIATELLNMLDRELNAFAKEHGVVESEA